MKTTMKMLLAIGTLVFLCLAAGCNNNQTRQPPNIIYILADDMGYGDVSACNPNAAWKTENIDRIAAGGMMFTDAHSGSAVCTPTRYGVLGQG